MSRHRSIVRLLVVLGVVAVAALYRQLAPAPASAPAPTATPGARTERRSAEAHGDAAIAEAFDARRSGVWVESSGTVERLLPDDRAGSRHQRFVVRLGDGRTLLFAHNIDLTPRVPVRAGAAVRFRGMYEWSERGGTVHWTHRDPDERHPGGWVEHEGRTYR